mmetsp:Transcript_3878/g.4000  ORF Transcript_3878/g.4000 Transcript_3878/m.4000 type:complete len:106 (+) Transcript_3878:2-319(+)
MNIVFNKNPFIWKSEQATKQKISNGANVGKKKPILTPPGITQTTQFSAVGGTGATLAMLDSQTHPDEISVNKPNSQPGPLGFTYDLAVDTTPISQSQHLSPSHKK